MPVAVSANLLIASIAAIATAGSLCTLDCGGAFVGLGAAGAAAALGGGEAFGWFAVVDAVGADFSPLVLLPVLSGLSAFM
jgi:hypothetical protein